MFTFIRRYQFLVQYFDFNEEFLINIVFDLTIWLFLLALKNISVSFKNVELIQY